MIAYFSIYIHVSITDSRVVGDWLKKENNEIWE